MSNNNILKNTNGSVLEKLKDGTKYFYIDYEDVRVTKEDIWDSFPCDSIRLLESNVFLTRQEAEKVIEMMEVKFRLTKKIKEIDRENGWVPDWSDATQSKYNISLNCNRNKKDFTLYSIYRNAEFFMSEQAKDYMMSDEVSLRDFKLFLGILDDDEKDIKRAEYMKLHYELIAKANELKKKAEEL